MDQRVPTPEDEHPGAGLGLPADGPGAVAGFGRRGLAFAFDAVASGLVARFLDPVDTRGQLDLTVSALPLAVLAVVYVVGLLLVGRTPGMQLLGLRVASLDGGAVPFVPAALRTALLLLLVPAVITDRDGRGLHDRASRTVVVRG